MPTNEKNATHLKNECFIASLLLKLLCEIKHELCLKVRNRLKVSFVYQLSAYKELETSRESY
jgi:hypothetical protein